MYKYVSIVFEIHLKILQTFALTHKVNKNGDLD